MGRPGRPLRRPAGRAGADIVLRPGRDKPVRQRHPWIFSGAIAHVGDDLRDGQVGTVRSAEGDVLGQGYVNRRSQIVVRMLVFGAGQRVDAGFWHERIARAVRLRPAPPSPARLVHAESDGLPGLIVDRYGDTLVLQSSTLGIDTHKADIVTALQAVTEARTVWERSDVDGRDKEGIEPVAGRIAGAEPPELLTVQERTHEGGEIAVLVDVRRGHKTGAYLDQSDNRRYVGSRSAGAEILNLFSYTGTFALHAARGGARHVTNVDSSGDALALSERMAAENGFGASIAHERADCFEILRRYRDEGRTFDGVVVDPPKFVSSAAQIDRGARAYKDLFRIAMQITRSGGWVACFSCSGLVSADLFQKIVWSASLEAARQARIERRLGQASDHPVLLSFPEGEYLKGLFCRLD